MYIRKKFICTFFYLMPLIISCSSTILNVSDYMLNKKYGNGKYCPHIELSICQYAFLKRFSLGFLSVLIDAFNLLQS